MKRKVAMVLTFALAVGAFSGCNSKKASETSVESAEESYETTEEESSEATEEETATTAESEETFEATEEETTTTVESEKTGQEESLLIDIGSLKVPDFECDKKYEAALNCISYYYDRLVFDVLCDQSVDEDLKTRIIEEHGSFGSSIQTDEYENGFLIYETIDDKIDFFQREIQYTYDGDRPTEMMISYVTPQGCGREDYVCLYEYTYKDDLLVKVTASKETAYQGTIEFSYNLSYKNGWLIMLSREEEDIEERYWFSYDDNGNVTRFIDETIGQDLYIADQYEYIYDENGNCLTETRSEYDPTTGQLDITWNNEYEYDEANNLICHTSQLSYEETKTDLTYDDKGNLLTETTLNGGSVERQATYEYEFDDEGRITKKVEEEVYDWSFDDPWTFTITWTYTYE